MVDQEFLIELHYGDEMNTGFMCTYVRSEVDVYNGTYEPDKISFFEIERIIKKIYGYKSRTLFIT